MSSSASPRVRHAALAGLVLFALSLLLSSWLKAASPAPAAYALAWSGLGFSSRVLVIDVWTVVEAVLAGALLVLWWHRVILTLGLLVALALTVMHGLGWALGSGDCGCFGDVAIPDGVTMALLGLGVFACATLLRAAAGGSGRRGGSTWLRGLGIVVLALGSTLPLWQRATPEGQPEVLMLEHVGEGSPDALFVIGSKDCGHCLEAMQEIEEERARSPELAELPVRFVVRDTDVGSGEALRGFAWSKTVAVPEDLWWRLLLSGPPSFLRVKAGQPQELRDTWRD